MGTGNSEAKGVVGRMRYIVESRAMFVVGLTILALWVVPVTRLVYAPHAVEVVGDQVTMYRTFPLDALGLPRPRLSYVETVRPLTPSHHDGQSCTDAGGPFQYTRDDEVGRWQIPWAVGCLSDPRGFIWSASWTWHIGGLTVGPVSLSDTFLRHD